MDNEEFCQKILKIDNKIRFVSIYDDGNFFHKMKEGKKSYLTQEETENSLCQAQYRWAARKKMASKIGSPVFAMAKYGKVFRFTIPVSSAGLILVSTELDISIEDIIEKICDCADKYYS
ncbi:MAG: hypothetical protein IIA20_02030 [Thaumarchaeota archaeon]|nr:hypothetical protein [Nitrososphaerota archaeon]